MAEHKRTKSCRRKKIVFGFFHFLALFAPFVYFIPQVYICGTVVNKATFTLAAASGLIIGLLGLFLEATHKAGFQKSMACCIMLGLAFYLPAVQPLLIGYSICSILDELIFIRLYEHYAELLRTNKEIDRRN